MKKYIAITVSLLSAAVLSLTAGCGGDIITNGSDDPERSSASDLPSGSSENNSTEISQSEPESSVPEIPKGEPTFLICPDGTPVYASEISEIYTGSEFDGNYEPLTLEQAERRAVECEGEFTVKCEGCAYGFIPERALNHADDPEMFNARGDEETYKFLGDKDKFSADFTKIKVGDTFGTLTVKSAYSLFGDNRFLEKFSETPGAYIAGGMIVFDGEVELTGYVDVWEDSANYPGAGGLMIFYPDGDSSVKIPVISYIFSEDDGLTHKSEEIAGGYFGDWYCSLGNMSEVGCDTSSLHKGDNFVRVRITAVNVTSGQYGVRLELKNLEAL